MTNFKVGDKVEVTSGARKGLVGTIKEHRGGRAIWPWHVEYPADSYGGTGFGIFHDSELKLMKPEPKFQVGDWVKVHGRGDKWDGTVGTVQKVVKPTYDQQNLYIIHKDDVADPTAKERGWSDTKLQFFESQLEATEAPAKFKKGDIVKSVGFQYMLFEGKTLIVHGPSNGKGYDYQVRALGEDYKPGHDFREDELVAGEPLAQWEIELVDYRPGKKALVDYAVADVKATTSLFKDAKGEAVEHPAHYGGGDNPYEAIKVIEAWGLGFNLGNAAKYLARAGKKGNKVEDLNKLIQYVQFEIAKEESK